MRDGALIMTDDRVSDAVRWLVEHSDVLMASFSPACWTGGGSPPRRCARGTPRSATSRCPAARTRPVVVAGHLSADDPARSGLSDRSSPPGRGDAGPGFSLNDHAAGLWSFRCAGRVGVGKRTGQRPARRQAAEGDGAYLIGPAMLDDLSNSREIWPNGGDDASGRLVPTECCRTADGGFAAITCRDDGHGIVWPLRQASPPIPRSPPSTLASHGSLTSTRRSGPAPEPSRPTPRKNYCRRQACPIGCRAPRTSWRTRSFPPAACGPHAARRVRRVQPFDRVPAIWSGTTLGPCVLSPT